MHQYCQKQFQPRRSSAFTILEIMIVIVIMAVLATIAIPRYSVTMEKTRSTEGVQILQALVQAQKVYRFENGSFTNDINNLEITIPTPQHFNTPTVSTTDPIATITRQNSRYTLSMTQNGVTTCSGDGGSGLCTQLGF